MATIDDLNEQATATAVLVERATGDVMVEAVVLTVVIPVELMDLINTGDTRSRVMIGWLKLAMDAAP